MRQTKSTYNARYRTQTKGKLAQARARRNWQCKQKYGITLAQREAMWHEQKGLCGLCSLPLPSEVMTNACDLDHNHATGKNRSLVHRKCNLLIAVVERNEALIPSVLSYLSRLNTLG